MLAGIPASASASTYTFTVEVGAIYVLGTICKVSRTYTVTVTP